MIPAGFIQDLLARTDIAEVIGTHVELKRSGANLSGLCPFHAEKTPSFSVTPGKNLYHCFGCGAGGDAIRFLGDHLGLSFVEAVRELAQRAGMQVPEEDVSPEERQRRETLATRRRSLGELLVRAADFYRAQLKASPHAIAYLKERGVTGAIAARFGLGYAPAGWRTLAGVFAQYDDPRLEEAGLVRRHDAGDADERAHAAAGHERGRYDWFRDRIMFPIRAVGGEIIGFGGRVLDDSKPKYINSPETPLFAKGRELYGLHEARQALHEKGCALVVEGYMDVVVLARSGLGHVVATLGTACTAEHVQKLFRFTDSVVFAFDGDAAGRRAAARALEAALPHASDLRSVKFLFLPPEHDPDSFVRERGVAAFETALAEAVPLSRQLVEQAAAGADLATAEGRARMLAHARPLWHALPAGALRDQMLGELAERARLPRADLASRWGMAGAPAQRSGLAVSRRAPPPRAAARLPQDQLVRLLLQRSDWWDELSGDDHQLLASLPGWHAELFRWLDRWVHEHGPSAWPELREPIGGEPWGAAALALIDDTEVPIEPLRDDLSAALAQTRRALQVQEAMKLLGRH
ncbi:MAG: DNA primase [Proteobacteria bacterium]|nr:DNA primase [Pseudomonadota bacterium]HOL37530.1 DNA primase [Rubrivivax sp.]